MKKRIFTVTIIVFAFLANVSAQLQVDVTGRVGIRTTNPRHSLDVAGNIGATGNIYVGDTSNFFGKINEVPIIFRAGEVLAGYTGSPEKNNVSFGYGALASLPNPMGNYNTAIGLMALYENWTGNYNTAIGKDALYYNTQGHYNTANGVNALYSNIAGSYNTANGGSALYSNTTGSYNTANGLKALYSNTSGNNNTAIGESALYSNTEGSNSTAIGDSALYSNTSGSNTAIGENALFSNTEGNYNTAIGRMALYSNITGYYNTAIGEHALYNNTRGDFNTAIGERALYNNTMGKYNTAIGLHADVNNDNLDNSTAIGHDAKATSSNQVRIGNIEVTSIGGYAAWTNLSDKRTNKNIRTDVPGLAFINRLQPVTFNFDLDAIDNLLKIDKTKRPDEEALSPELIAINKKAREAKEKVKQTGFIAQDVEEITKSIGYNFSGVDVDETGIYGLRYAEFVVPLVKAVQELSEQNNRQQAQIEELLTTVRQLSGKTGNANDFNGTGGE